MKEGSMKAEENRMFLSVQKWKECPSPKGLLGQLDNVGSGLHIDVVVVQGGGISGGASLSQ